MEQLRLALRPKESDAWSLADSGERTRCHVATGFGTTQELATMLMFMSNGVAVFTVGHSLAADGEKWFG
ncbi:hypothetical protein BH10ACT3_BH10ACT3_12900 [soil metagenome]